MKVIFLVSGKSFSNLFLQSWTNLIQEINEKNIKWKLFTHYHPEVHMCRNELLDGKFTEPINQNPWQDKLDYDKIMWIDSDIIFKPDDFFRLLKHDKPIVSGLYYKMNGPTINHTPLEFACAKKNNNSSADSLTLNDIEGKKELIEVRGNGMGFMMVNKGVFETINYPWFEPRKIYYEKSGVEDAAAFYSEDINFQLKAKKCGIKSFVDPNIIVGHEKSIILI